MKFIQHYNGNLVIIRGLPGSGKTTMATELFPEYEKYEADDYFYKVDACNYRYEYVFDASKLRQAHATCLANVTDAIEDGANVVVSNTFTTLKELQPYIDAAKANNYRVFIIEANGVFKFVHNVPDETIMKMEKRWQRVEQNKDGSWNSY